MDQRQNAIEQINSIQEVFNSGTQVRVLSRWAFLVGFGFIQGAIVYATSHHGLNSVGYAVFRLAVILTFLGVYLIASRRGLSLRDATSSAQGPASLHPLIRQGLGLTTPLLVSACGNALIWWQHPDRIAAAVLLFFGLAMNLIGRFAQGRIAAYSYVLIVGGIVIAALEENQVLSGELAWIGFAFAGLWAVVLAFMLKNNSLD